MIYQMDTSIEQFVYRSAATNLKALELLGRDHT